MIFNVFKKTKTGQYSVNLGCYGNVRLLDT